METWYEIEELIEVDTALAPGGQDSYWRRLHDREGQPYRSTDLLATEALLDPLRKDGRPVRIVTRSSAGS